MKLTKITKGTKDTKTVNHTRRVSPCRDRWRGTQTRISGPRRASRGRRRHRAGARTRLRAAFVRFVTLVSFVLHIVIREVSATAARR